MAYVNSLQLLLPTIIFSNLRITTALKSSLNLSEGTTWVNNDRSLPSKTYFKDHSLARFILLRETQVHSSHFGFGFCFYCPVSFFVCYLSMAFVEMSNGTILSEPPQIVWSANWDNPVGENAVLSFSGGSLVLTNTKGFEVWSTCTTSLPAFSLDINKQGNLLLSNMYGFIAWQSFDHFTDTLVDGQMLKEAKRLISSISSKTFGAGLFYASIYSGTLSAYVEAGNPTRYLHVSPKAVIPDLMWLKSVLFRKGRLIFFYMVVNEMKNITKKISHSGTVQILKLDADGGLRVYGWKAGKGWRKVYAFIEELDECRFPLICGRYGLCKRGNCTCPVGVDGVQYFKPKRDIYFPKVGCSYINEPSSMAASDDYQLVNFGNLSYYSYYDTSQAMPGIEDEVGCIGVRSRSLLCKAAFFNYQIKIQKGYCYLSEDVFSLRETPVSRGYYSSSHIKVVVHSPSQVSKSSISLRLVLSAICAIVLTLVIVTIVYAMISQKKQIDDWKDDESAETLKQVLEIPMRFSYRELSIATSKFVLVKGTGC